MILDIEDDARSRGSSSSQSADSRPSSVAVEQGAEKLYGLIHARYVLTKPGLQLISERFKNSEFGSCQRTFCHENPVVPVGRFDAPGLDTVKLFCPRCGDLYHPREVIIDREDFVLEVQLIRFLSFFRQNTEPSTEPTSPPHSPVSYSSHTPNSYPNPPSSFRNRDTTTRAKEAQPRSTTTRWSAGHPEPPNLTTWTFPMTPGLPSEDRKREHREARRKSRRMGRRRWFRGRTRMFRGSLGSGFRKGRGWGRGCRG